MCCVSAQANGPHILGFKFQQSHRNASSALSSSDRAADPATSAPATSADTGGAGAGQVAPPEAAGGDSRPSVGAPPEDPEAAVRGSPVPQSLFRLTASLLKARALDLPSM